MALWIIASSLTWNNRLRFPGDRIAYVQTTIFKARAAKAEVYASSSYLQAKKLYGSAFRLVNIENNKWFPCRKYQVPDSLFSASALLAIKSENEALMNRKKFDATTSRKFEELQARYRQLKKFIGWLP